jgi:iron(III) transport system substrate-binding protein
MKIFRAILLSLSAAMIFLSACIPTRDNINPTSSPELLAPVIIPTSTPLPAKRDYYIPPYYSPFYIETVQYATSETELIIYSTLSEENWAPIVRGFKEHYPWMSLKTFNLAASETFTRYRDENAQGQRTADLIISSDLAGWQNFIKAGEILTYPSQEDPYLPIWSKTGVGIYTISSDPLLIIYNKRLVRNPPQTMADLAKLAQTPSQANKIATYNVETNSNGFYINWFWSQYMMDNGWQILAQLSKSNLVFNNSENEIIQAVSDGTLTMAYFVSSTAVFPRLPVYPDLGWTYIKDGQPIFLRNMAITQASRSPNSAKLFVDYILSQEGQMAIALGGLTPYRSDIIDVSTIHLEYINNDVSQDRLIFFSFDPDLTDQAKVEEFLARWQSVMNPLITIED